MIKSIQNSLIELQDTYRNQGEEGEKDFVNLNKRKYSIQNFCVKRENENNLERSYASQRDLKGRDRSFGNFGRGEEGKGDFREFKRRVIEHMKRNRREGEKNFGFQEYF